MRINKIEAIFSTPEEIGLNEESIVPEFSLLSVDNSKMNLSQLLTSDYNLLVFSSPDCPACVNFWPDLLEIQKTYPEVNIIMISKGNIDQVKQMITENSFTFNVLLWDDDVASKYKVIGTPFLYLINKEKMIMISGFSESIQDIARVISTK